MKRGHLTRPIWLVVTVTVLVALTACGGNNSSGGAASGGSSDDKSAVDGWTDQTDTAALLSVILQDNGYTTKTLEVSDNDPLYTGLSNGDVDVLSSSWLERTHKSYWQRYGNDIADLGTYYDNAQNYLAVTTYSDIKSIDQLPQHAAELGNRIVGIEPGAGLTELTQDSVMPAYGLTGYKLALSSTTTMLTELKKATDAKQPIVVTLWKPFWANEAFPVRPLQDPKGAYGPPEKLHTVASKEFASSHPEVANMLAHFTLTDKQFATLEDTIVNKCSTCGSGTGAGLSSRSREREQAARAWLAANPGYEEQLAAYLKKQ